MSRRLPLASFNLACKRLRVLEFKDIARQAWIRDHNSRRHRDITGRLARGFAENTPRMLTHRTRHPSTKLIRACTVFSRRLHRWLANPLHLADPIYCRLSMGEGSRRRRATCRFMVTTCQVLINRVAVDL